jgi:hypothetical protein
MLLRVTSNATHKLTGGGFRVFATSMPNPVKTVSPETLRISQVLENEK